MSNSFILPSYFGTPFTTDIPSSRYDSKGRQLSFVETEVQRLERMALVVASKSRSTQNSQPFYPKLVAEPYDPIELKANPKEWSCSSWFDGKQQTLHSKSTPKSLPPISPQPPSERLSLSSIREEE